VIEQAVLAAAGVEQIPVEIRAYPREDEAFRDAILRDLARLDRVRDIRRICSRLESALALEYPAAKIRLQHPLAADGGGMAVIYAYRNGSFVPEHAAEATAAAAQEPVLAGAPPAG
jgi:hypothetical protein